jgi:hypothetical protein
VTAMLSSVSLQIEEGFIAALSAAGHEVARAAQRSRARISGAEAARRFTKREWYLRLGRFLVDRVQVSARFSRAQFVAHTTRRFV